MKHFSSVASQLSVLLFLFLVVFCDKKDEEPVSKIIPYFDIESYFKNETDFLDSMNVNIVKDVESEEKFESKTFSEVNFRKELEAFINSGINKPAWRGAFRVDTITIDSVTTKIKYLSINNDKVLIKEAELLFLNNSCIFVGIKKENNNLFYQFKQELKYQKGHGYSIKSKQSLKWIYSSDYTIKTTFK